MRQPSTSAGARASLRVTTRRRARRCARRRRRRRRGRRASARPCPSASALLGRVGVDARRSATGANGAARARCTRPRRARRDRARHRLGTERRGSTGAASRNAGTIASPEQVLVGGSDQLAVREPSREPRRVEPAHDRDRDAGGLAHHQLRGAPRSRRRSRPR